MQFQPYQNQPQGGQPPTQITTKDLSYVKDAMSWELTAMKKCHHFAKECNDNQLRQAMRKAGEMHQNHYQILLNHIDPSKMASY